VIATFGRAEKYHTLNTSCTEVWKAPPFMGPPPAIHHGLDDEIESRA